MSDGIRKQFFDDVYTLIYKKTKDKSVLDISAAEDMKLNISESLKGKREAELMRKILIDYERKISNYEKNVEFLEKLTDLLNKSVNPKSEDTLNGEKFCEMLRWKLVAILEDAHKLGLFNDDFNLSIYISENIDAPLKRLKEQIDKPWLKDKLTIGLLGHWSTGKTTALNLLFDERFKVDDRESTAIATYLTYGKNDKVITLVDRNGQSQDVSLVESEIFDYSYDKKLIFPFARIFNYMVKENSSPILKNLTFIDTPGLFSSKTGHSKPTLDVVSACDVFFWFIDINVSLTKDDIKSMIGIGERPVFVIFTFVDKAAPSQLQKAIERISKDTEKAGVNIKGYLKLGKREDIRQQFKKEALSVINNLSNEYEPYVPSMHVLNVAYSLEKFLVKHQNGITSQINELDVERRKLLAEYDNSVRKFEMAIHVMKQKVDIVTSTFKNKCRKTWSCMGNTYSILEKNLDNMVESIKDMERVYDGVESLRLVTYGRDVAKIEFLQNRLKIIDEILLRIEEIKKLFK